MSILHYRGSSIEVSSNQEMQSMIKALDDINARMQRRADLLSIKFGHEFHKYSLRCECGLEEYAYLTLHLNTEKEPPICPVGFTKQWKSNTSKPVPEEYVQKLKEEVLMANRKSF